jgi:hypothetical protein
MPGVALQVGAGPFFSEVDTVDEWRFGGQLVSRSVLPAVQQGRLSMCSLILVFMLGRRMPWREVRNSNTV